MSDCKIHTYEKPDSLKKWTVDNILEDYNKTRYRAVVDWLFEKGYDGLTDDEGCYCTTDDLMPCGSYGPDCHASYFYDCPSCDMECKFRLPSSSDPGSELLGDGMVDSTYKFYCEKKARKFSN